MAVIGVIETRGSNREKWEVIGARGGREAQRVCVELLEGT